MSGSCTVFCGRETPWEVPAVGPEIILGFYALLGLGALVLAVLLYVRAMASRTVYRCPQCKELINVELMQARRCNTCGAPLSYPGREHPDSRGTSDGFDS
jgi:DNA-directed RNA polymerase subunit RPC12/RpoP